MAGVSSFKASDKRTLSVTTVLLCGTGYDLEVILHFYRALTQYQNHFHILNLKK